MDGPIESIGVPHHHHDVLLTGILDDPLRLHSKAQGELYGGFVHRSHQRVRRRRIERVKDVPRTDLGRIERVAAPPVGSMHHVAQRRQALAVHLGHEHAGLPDWFVDRVIDGEPISAAEFNIALLLTLQPEFRFLTIHRLGPESHDIFVAEHLGHKVEIVIGDFTQREARTGEHDGIVRRAADVWPMRGDRTEPQATRCATTGRGFTWFCSIAMQTCTTMPHAADDWVSLGEIRIRIMASG